MANIGNLLLIDATSKNVVTTIPNSGSSSSPILRHEIVINTKRPPTRADIYGELSIVADHCENVSMSSDKTWRGQYENGGCGIVPSSR